MKEEKIIHEYRVIETEDGYRIEIKGDKEKLNAAGFPGMISFLGPGMRGARRMMKHARRHERRGPGGPAGRRGARGHGRRRSWGNNLSPDQRPGPGEPPFWKGGMWSKGEDPKSNKGPNKGPDFV